MIHNPEPILAPPTAFYNSGAFKRSWQVEGVKVNLGSGKDYRKGWINVDLHHSADLQFDITGPWPLESCSVNLVWANQILEHLPPLNERGEDCLLHVLREISRVLVPGGKAMISVPYPGSVVDLANVTHYRRFCIDSFHFLEPGSRSHLAADYGLKVINRKVIRQPPFGGAARSLPNGPPKELPFYPNFGRKVGLAWVLLKD